VTQVTNSAAVTGSNIAPIQSDDPSKPGSADATTFPVTAGAAIPNVDVWALIALAAMLGLLGLYMSTR
jgi:hypothetical protein